MPVARLPVDVRPRDADTWAEVDMEDADPLQRARAVAHLLDEAVRIPGTDYRIGLDPLLGLLPVVGDAPAAAASAYVVATAAALGVPHTTLARMFLVVAVDAVVGSLPLVGDVFDAAFKANVRNVRLLEARLERPEAAVVDRRLLLAAGAAVCALLFILGVVSTAAAWWLLGRLA
jgi:hypothetical protein